MVRGLDTDLGVGAERMVRGLNTGLGVGIEKRIDIEVREARITGRGEEGGGGAWLWWNHSNPKIKGAVVSHTQGPHMFDYSIRLNHTWAFSGFPDVRSIMDMNGPYLTDLQLGVNPIQIMQYNSTEFLTGWWYPINATILEEVAYCLYCFLHKILEMNPFELSFFLSILKLCHFLCVLFGIVICSSN